MERPFTLDHLDHVVLRVRDLPKATAFYQMLGGEVSPRANGTTVRITDSQTVILQERPNYVPSKDGALDHINLAIRASSIQDVCAYLRANGATIVREPDEDRSDPTLRVSDPDGHIVEIRMKAAG